MPVLLGLSLLFLIFLADSDDVTWAISLFGNDASDLTMPYDQSMIKSVSTLPNDEKEKITDSEFLVSPDGHLLSLWLPIDSTRVKIDFQSASLNKIWSSSAVHVTKNAHGDTNLTIGGYSMLSLCHFESKTPGIYGVVSNCSGFLSGMIIAKNNVYLIDQSNESLIFPDNDKNNDSRKNTSSSNYDRSKRENSMDKEGSFCGVGKEPIEFETGESLAVVLPYNMNKNHKKWWDHLVIELAVFADQYLWDQFVKLHGTDSAYSKLQDFLATTLYNVQMLYDHETIKPKVTFKIVRYEVLKHQPSELRNIRDAQSYLNEFCKYQYRWKGRQWDHAIMFTGLDLIRWGHDLTISGIAHVNGVCDPAHSCLLAEAFGFRAVFIAAHEIGHGLGMHHDEPLCESRFIMSESLGQGKVVWSKCSMNDFNKQLNRLNVQGLNCMTVDSNHAVMSIYDGYLPGQKYDVGKQCELSSGLGFSEVKIPPYTNVGICQIVYCKHKYQSRAYTTHPALEGTVCETGKYCIGGKCVPMPNQKAPVHGGWSSWSTVDCSHCGCPPVAGGLSVLRTIRSCTNPYPINGGTACSGDNTMGVVCGQAKCRSNKPVYGTVDDYLQLACTNKKKQMKSFVLLGTGTQIVHNAEKACKVFCNVRTGTTLKNFRFYGDFLPDGVPCGNRKYCLDGRCTALQCDGATLATSSPQCHTTQRCLDARHNLRGVGVLMDSAAPAQWSQWSAWSACSAQCGAGIQTRNRRCSNSASNCDGHDVEKKSCQGTSCLQSAGGWQPNAWTQWSAWSECSVTCGRGVQYRDRKCTKTSGCHGYPKEESVCYRNGGVCPATSKDYAATAWEQFGDWSVWEPCSATCGTGVQFRRRRGRFRDQTENRSCQGADVCAHWGGWGYWSECGNDRRRRRVRQCNGLGECSGSSIDSRNC